VRANAIKCRGGLLIVQMIAGDADDGGRQISGLNGSARRKNLESGLSQADGHATANTTARASDQGGWH